MLRHTNHRQLIRILQGDDLEFRITQYPIKVSGRVELEGLTFPHDLNFKDSFFDQLVFRNCRFHGKLSFINCSLNILSFDACEMRDVDIEESQSKQLSLIKSEKVHRFHIGSSSINDLRIEENFVFEAIEVACENNIMSAHIEGNGNSVQNSFKSTIYICPERFDQMILKNNTSEILHIGTIGQYSSFEIDNYNANLVLFSNCNSTNSKVHFKNLKPIDPYIASVCIVNSERIFEMKQDGVFDGFRSFKKYSEEVEDFRKLRSLTG